MTMPRMPSGRTAVALTCDLNGALQPLRHPWRTCVGSGHATLALRADWQAQMRRAKADLDFRYVRFHGLLDDDMGTVVRQNGQWLYSFFNADQIFDFLISIGMRPIVELSFMPSALSSGDDTVFHYRGNITPPRDQAQWGDLMHRLAAHWVGRYGIEEVSQWYFEVWNEPNLPIFWAGGQHAYFQLYETTVGAIKRVDRRLRVGGPATAANAWIDAFQAFCRKRDLPVDFISTHFYMNDASKEPDADPLTQLEHAPPLAMRQQALKAREQARGKPLLYTEWNITSGPRDPLHDGPFAAALAARIAMSVDDVVDACSYWAVSDIFEENGFPDKPFHGGFGLFNLHGIKKPVYAAFQMIGLLGERHFPVRQAHPAVMLWVGETASRPTATHVLCINQAMPRHDVNREEIVLRLKARPGRRARGVAISRIDENNANPAALWRRMGSPDYLSGEQVDTLRRAAEPVDSALPFDATDDEVLLRFHVEPQSVNCLSIQWDHG